MGRRGESLTFQSSPVTRMALPSRRILLPKPRCREVFHQGRQSTAPMQKILTDISMIDHLLPKVGHAYMAGQNYNKAYKATNRGTATTPSSGALSTCSIFKPTNTVTLSMPTCMLSASIPVSKLGSLRKQLHGTCPSSTTSLSLSLWILRLFRFIE